MLFLRADPDTNALLKYPYTFAHFKKDFPRVSVRKDMDNLIPYGVRRVTEAAEPAPANPATHRVVEVDPVFNGSEWVQTWSEVALTPAQQQALANEAEANAVAAALKANPWISTYADMSVAQVETYVANNVTDLASAKDIIEKLAIICLLLVKREKNS